MGKKFKEVLLKDLRLQIDPKSLKVRSTGELCPSTQGVVGQDRAIEALKFGIGMHDPEYNVYMAGTSNTGATYIARAFLEKVATKELPPPDL